MTHPPDSRWLHPFQVRPNVRISLVCIPHAGGTAAVYRSWHLHLSPEIGVIGVELPGRGFRIDEPRVARLEELLASLGEALSRHVTTPLVLFGHSFGGLLAFELGRMMLGSGGSEPSFVAVSARAAPHICPPRAPTDDDALLDLLRSGTPPAVLQNDRLKTELMGRVRADFQLVSEHRWLGTPPLACPLAVYGGDTDDGVSAVALARWRDLAGTQFRMNLLPGDHFFYQTCLPDFLRLLESHIREFV